jgi:hypothetical protein
MLSLPSPTAHNLELSAFKRPNDQHRWWSVAQAGGGFIDFCTVTDDLASDIQAFRDAGVKMSDPAPGGRVRPDGYKLSWVIAFAPKPFLFQVPLLLQDHTPRAERSRAVMLRVGLERF